MAAGVTLFKALLTSHSGVEALLASAVAAWHQCTGIEQISLWTTIALALCESGGRACGALLFINLGFGSFRNACVDRPGYILVAQPPCGLS